MGKKFEKSEKNTRMLIVTTVEGRKDWATGLLRFARNDEVGAEAPTVVYLLLLALEDVPGAAEGAEDC